MSGTSLVPPRGSPRTPSPRSGTTRTMPSTIGCSFGDVVLIPSLHRSDGREEAPCRGREFRRVSSAPSTGRALGGGAFRPVGTLGRRDNRRDPRDSRGRPPKELAARGLRPVRYVLDANIAIAACNTPGTWNPRPHADERRAPRRPNGRRTKDLRKLRRGGGAQHVHADRALGARRFLAHAR